MNYQQYQQSMTLDLKDTLWRLLSQWKAVVVFSLIAAMLICGIKHSEDVRKYNAAVSEAEAAAKRAELPLEERIRDLVDTLPEEERMPVYYVLDEQNWLDSEKEYLNNSILMQTDPTNQRVLKTVFGLRSENGDQMAAIVGSYYGYLSGNEIAEAIKPYIKESADNRYISELIALDKQDANIYNQSGESTDAHLSFNIVLTEDADADAVAGAVKKSLEEHSASIQKMYPHSVFQVYSEDVHEYDSINVSKSSSTFSSINSVEKSLKDAKANLSKEQTAILTSILEYQKAEELAESETETAEVEKPVYKLSYAVLGFILGMLLYAFVYAAILIFRGRLNTPEEAATNTGARVLEEVYVKGKASGISGLLHSAFFEKIRRKGKLEAPAQIARLAESVEAVCEQKGTKEITLLNFADKNGFSDILGDIVKAFEAKGIHADVVAAGEDFNEKALNKAENAVYAVSDDVRQDDAKKMAGLCKEFNVDSIGSIWLGEY